MKIVRKIFFQTNSILLGRKSKRFSFQTYLKPVVDPWFPRRGGANRKGGAPTYYFGQFSLKPLWKWKKIGPRLRGIPGAPLGSTNGQTILAHPLDPPVVKLFWRTPWIHQWSNYFAFIVSRCEQALSRGYWSWKKRYSPDRSDIHHPWQFSLVRILDHRDQFMNNSTESNFNIAKEKVLI